MPDYRRYFVPGGTYFFTVVTQGRAQILCGAAARLSLRAAFRACKTRWPFRIDAIVLLPDHF
ncbi:MAG TPA: transposase, partial [Pirellulales bacterium]|nr:transposase [Pirellulales bacterium]